MPSRGSRLGGRSGGPGGPGGPAGAVSRSGVLVATKRCYVLWAVDARPAIGGALSAASPTLPSVDGISAAPGPREPRALAVVEAERAEEGQRWSLSPSRAADFLTCPLLYRFRVIDRLPEAPSQAMARGTLV